MKDDSLSDTDYCPKCDCHHSYKIDCSVGKQAVIAQDKIGRNVYYRETWNEAVKDTIAKMTDLGVQIEIKTWNEAIEAAIRIVFNKYQDNMLIQEIRKLKK